MLTRKGFPPAPPNAGKNAPPVTPPETPPNAPVASPGATRGRGRSRRKEEAPADPNRRGLCGPYRATMTADQCREYRRPCGTFANGPSRLNQGCQGCPGLDFGVKL